MGHRAPRACQAFALWLGLIPEEKEQLAAQQMHQAVLDAGTRLTTATCAPVT